MPFVDIPVIPSEAHYRFGVVIEDVGYLVDVRWNARDTAWYLDWYTLEEKIIALNLKVVLGAYLGRRYPVPPFSNGVLVAVDTSGNEVEAGFDDFGTRVVLRYILVIDLIAQHAAAAAATG